MLALILQIGSGTPRGWYIAVSHVGKGKAALKNQFHSPFWKSVFTNCRKWKNVRAAIFKWKIQYTCPSNPSYGREGEERVYDLKDLILHVHSILSLYHALSCLLNRAFVRLSTRLKTNYSFISQEEVSRKYESECGLKFDEMYLLNERRNWSLNFVK